jgi:hypothetical protein
MKRNLLIAISIFSLVIALLISERVLARQELRVEVLGLEADPTSYSGQCPGLIKFKGRIQANGSVRVKYTYSYSDGGSGPEGFVDFEGPGVKNVETTWRLGDVSVLPRYEGWAMLKILSPNTAESNKAQFILDCKQSGAPQQPQPQPARPGAAEEKQTAASPGQTSAERLNLSAPAQLVPDNSLEPILKQRVTPPKPDSIRLIPDKNFAGIFLIKFVEGSHVRYRGGGFLTAKDQINKEEARRLGRLQLSIDSVAADLAKVNNLIRAYTDKYGFTVSSTFQNERNRQDPEAQFKEKEMLEAEAGEELADLDLYYTIAAPHFKDLPAQEAFMNELNQLASVELVEAAFLTEAAGLRTSSPTTLFEPQAATPDLSANQNYLDAAPVGINARYAWTIPGGRGDGVKLIDVEYDWITDHEDFASAANRFWGGRPACAYDGVNIRTGEGSGGSEHGTAVLGVLNAPHNGFGVSGIVPNIRYGLSSVCRPFDFAGPFFFSLFSGESVAGRSHSIVTSNAIDLAAGGLERGDVLLIEQHTFGPASGLTCTCNCGQWEYVPMEFYQESFDVIRRATARGIIVVEAAGNGAQDLDAPRYGRRFDPAFRHSGAILVGASRGNGDTNRACFSNFGRRIDLHGWGGMVTTLGYGSGPSGRIAPWNVGVINRFYTNNFGGTSSASPIVAGAVASIQGARRASAREPFNASQMRTLLDQTGTPQTRPGSREDDALRVQAIGRLPDLRAALDATLDRRTARGTFAGMGTYFIQARHSGKVLDVNIDWFSGQDNGRPVGQFDNNNGDHQKFIVESVGEGYFRLRARHSGKCLDVTDISRSPGAGLQQWQCNGGPNQQFAIEPVGDFYKIRARHSGLYLDIRGFSPNNSARLQQFNWTGGNNQLFQFIVAR